MTTATTAVTATNSALQSYLNQQAQNVAADQAAATSSGSSTNATTGAATQGVFKNEATFLNILTTQLKNQDPSSASDPNQFTQELVEFAGVEQQLNTNSDLQQLITLQKNNGGVTSALNYIGGYAESTTTTGQMSLQNGSSEIGYTLPSAAQSVTVTVKDSSGNTVATLTGPTTQGLNYLSWNGQDSSGNQLSDGAYTFSVAATDTSGNAETITDMRVIGKVTGVSSNSDGTTNLSLGTVSVSTSTVDAVYTSGNLPKATAA